MPNYRRTFVPGGTWFFTVNLLRRRGSNLLVREIELLRSSVRRVRAKHPFRIDAWVVLPEHMHCIWTLPPDDGDFSTRWRLIKHGVSRSLPRTERIADLRAANGERGIWQHRFWEHLLRDGTDFTRHFDYVHVNPVKHGYVRRVRDWPYSTFHRCVAGGIYPENWCGDMDATVPGED